MNKINVIGIGFRPLEKKASEILIASDVVLTNKGLLEAFKDYAEYEDVKERYRNLYDDWKDSVGLWKSIQMIMCELNRLGPVADQLCRNGVDIVIFGHSHDTKMDKDTFLVKDRIYANCGYWCGFGEDEDKDDNAHFVETDGKTVKLNYLKNGGAVTKKTLVL